MDRRRSRRSSGLCKVRAATVVIAAAACSQSGQVSSPPQRRGGAASPSAEAGYVSPPELSLAIREGGRVGLSGFVAPGWTVTLQAPEGDAVAAVAGRDGRWRLSLPAPARARMYAVSASGEGRSTHAEGALILAPPPFPPAILARAGTGAMAFATATGPVIEAVDYDAQGFAAVSGRAKPRATVGLFMDGAPAGVDQADAAGRYAVLIANHALGFGDHLALVKTAAGSVERAFRMTRPAALNAPYLAERVPGAWRVEWATPGGGAQTTLLLASRAGD